MEHFFFPNSSGNLRSDAHHSQIIGGAADVDHTQTIGGDTVKLLRGIYPSHPPRVSAPLIKTYVGLNNKSLFNKFCPQIRYLDTAGRQKMDFLPCTVFINFLYVVLQPH